MESTGWRDATQYAVTSRGLLKSSTRLQLLDIHAEVQVTTLSLQGRNLFFCSCVCRLGSIVSKPICIAVIRGTQMC